MFIKCIKFDWDKVSSLVQDPASVFFLIRAQTKVDNKKKYETGHNTTL